MLTARQQDTLEFIRRYMSEKNQAPTEAEIAKGIGIISRGVVHRYVKALEKSGFIKTIPGKKRNIRLRHNYKNQVLGLPLLGQLVTEGPITPVNNFDVFNINSSLLKPNRYLLQMNDPTLRNVGIFPGDFIICELKHQASNGEIAVVIVDEKIAVLKTVHINSEGDFTLSDPYTGEHPETVAQKRVKIHGIYQGLFRLLE